MKQVKSINGYEHLKEMCSFYANFTAFNPRINPITNRVWYISQALKQMGVSYEMDYFDAKNPNTLHIGREKLVNIVVNFKGTSNNTIVYLAHHDVCNKTSENAQDNTASCCNLLDLCQRLKGQTLENNVVVCFTDAEEIVQLEACGAKRLAIRINRGDFGNVLYAVNLELTANGKNVWASCQNHNSNLLTKLNISNVRTPYNDSVVLERNGIDSVCIGTLTDIELRIAKARGYCSTWYLCHSKNDVFGNAIEGDMNDFVDFLETLK